LDESRPRICPKCRQEVPEGIECPRCGVLVDRARELVDSRLASKRLRPVVFSKPTRTARKIALAAVLALAVLAWFRTRKPEGPITDPAPAIRAPVETAGESTAGPDPFHDTPPYTSEVWHEGAYGYGKAVLEQASGHVPLMLYFYKNGDPGCALLEGALLKDSEVRAFTDRLVKARVDPDDGPEEDALYRRHRAEGVPSILLGTPGKGEFRPVVTFAETSGERATVSGAAFVESCRSLLAYLSQNQVFLGAQAVRGGRPEAAGGHYDRALELNPRNPEAYRGRGLFRQAQGNLSGALEDFTAWSRLAENDPESALSLAGVYLELGRSSEAIPPLDRVISLHPKYKKGRAHLLRATAHENLGDAERALEDARRACELGSDEGCGRLDRLTTRGG